MKSATTKQLGLIQWMIRMNKPEFEKLKGYKDIKKLNLLQASILIDMMKNEEWNDAKLTIKQFAPEQVAGGGI